MNKELAHSLITSLLVDSVKKVITFVYILYVTVVFPKKMTSWIKTGRVWRVCVYLTEAIKTVYPNIINERVDTKSVTLAALF